MYRTKTEPHMTRREAKGLLSAVKDRIVDIKKFAAYTVGYVTINLSFFWVNMFEGPDEPVFLIPFFITSIFLFFQWKKVFGRKGKVTKRWEEALMHEFMYGEELPPEEEEPLRLISKPEVKPKKERRLKLKPAKKEEINTLQKRIENLEAIITSQRWQDFEDKELEMVMNNRPKKLEGSSEE